LSALYYIYVLQMIIVAQCRRWWYTQTCLCNFW